ncbi:cofactor assembly of complex C subunit B [Spirulina sp. CS-785/01]|uniref:cofactor assembly of complex C subunit B n=1 Tax=Spirulina sp. CS-785/01 TaxID=3021716 RepID=UPI00232D8009|nr:cofactor assembly of complex C subunit B [Spirulina sp. CS-785/01]MDB9314836.1 cofactor assembly of complex C subunit B [Spirulina sp. CS-785/01]
MAQADPNRVLRLLPLVAGTLGGVLLLINRSVTENLTGTQSRSDVLGVLLSALLILVGLLWQQVQPRSPDAVELEGTQQFDLAEDIPDEVRKELAWASHLLLTNTVTKAIVAYYGDRLLLRRGILPEKQEVSFGAIAKRVIEKQKPVYLVDLKVYPGKIEFDYLPLNTQGVICQPLGEQGILVLGANAPRSYTKQDERWITGIAEKLSDTLAVNL